LKKLCIFDFYRRRIDPTYHEATGKQRPFCPKETPSEEFPDHPLDAVAVHGTRYLSCDDHAEGIAGKRRLFDEDLKVGK